MLGLPREAPPPLAPDDEPAAETLGIEARVRGSLVHALLEELDFARPAAPGPEQVRELAGAWGVELSPR